ncbi:MAG: hypothetical protein KF868_14135 [Acidobacteria bacterium]|nr:hypothetical protein [Acidobacteriota bacterium]MCW5971137.1 hypothetical protein [Blastocatellales bacterium]
MHARLSLQPEADRLRRRLGKRFLAPGREVTFLIGALTFGSERYTARITRIQDLDDERLTVALNDGEPSLTWSAREGVKSDGNQVEGSLRTIVERLALDSPDQFIFAQLRGAAYFTAARLVRPAEAGASDNYSGPLWNIVRISEPSGGAQNRPQSLWRLYYTNAATGLIDKVLSREQGRTVAAEFSEWVNQGGELTPVRTVWKLNDQEVMSLTLANLTYSPKQ